MTIFLVDQRGASTRVTIVQIQPFYRLICDVLFRKMLFELLDLNLN